MITIVPLAGPDFLRSDGSIKPLFEVDGQPLLHLALTSRPWLRQGVQRSDDMLFVLRDLPQAHAFVKQLADWFPGSRCLYLSDLTAGAALSALAATCLAGSFDRPLCIDLADVLYSLDDPVSPHFTAEPDLGGVGLSFESESTEFSYFALAADGTVERAVEKQVISRHASAGTYFFRDVPTYLEAVAHSMRNADSLAYRELLYVCPTLNGVVAAGRLVRPLPVDDARPIKLP